MLEGKHLYEFGPFRLNPAERLLLRDDKAIPLTPKAFDTLLLLVENSGHLVSKDELMKRVWPGTFVEEVNLAQNISTIRRALDGKGGEQYIETVPKGGYRFIGETRRIASEGSPAVTTAVEQPGTTAAEPGKRAVSKKLLMTDPAVLAIAVGVLVVWRSRLSFATGAAPMSAARIRSIAVLPLSNLSSDQQQEYFSDGMTDELITNLAKFSKLRVISHTSVQRYKETKRPLPEIAQELGVDAIVEGTVLRSGDRVRITAQLIDARSDAHLWADSYERDLRDVLALQNEVAEDIASRVGNSLTAGERAGLKSAPVLNPIAHEAYLRGNFYLNRLSCDGYQKGLNHFQKAAAEDSGYAMAYVGMAHSYLELADWGCLPQDEAIRGSKAAAQKAIQLDGSLGPAHAWLGKVVFFYEWDWPQAEKELKLAIQLDPSYVPAHLAYAEFLVAMSRREEGYAEMSKALELDPTSGQTNYIWAYLLYVTRQYDRAIDQAKRTIEYYPDSSFVYFWLGASYERKGMNKQASEAYLKSKALDGAKPKTLEAFRAAYDKAGIKGFWQHELEVTKRTEPVDTCWISAVYAHLGETERTLQSLDRGFERHCRDLEFLNVEPIYDHLRTDPRFLDLLRRLRYAN